MTLNNINIEALIKKVQKEVRKTKPKVTNTPTDTQEPAPSEIFNEMKKLPFTE